MQRKGSEDPAVFNEEVFSDRRITVAPLVVLLGFAIEIIGISWIRIYKTSCRPSSGHGPELSV